jgi:hypothetical protein
VEEKLLAIEDLAIRWGVSASRAWTVVRECQVPFLVLGGRKIDLNARGPKPVKFRPAAIEAWEKAREGVWDGPGCDREPKIDGTITRRPGKIMDRTVSTDDAWQFFGLKPPRN